jgi:anti-anti-sigma factor
MSEHLTITTTTTLDDRGQLMVAVAGEVDLLTAPQISECLAELMDRDVTVDLSAVTFLDSSGIAALIQAKEAITAAGHRFRTFGEQDIVLRVLEIAGLDTVFHAEQPSH